MEVPALRERESGHEQEQHAATPPNGASGISQTRYWGESTFVKARNPATLVGEREPGPDPPRAEHDRRRERSEHGEHGADTVANASGSPPARSREIAGAA